MNPHILCICCWSIQRKEFSGCIQYLQSNPLHSMLHPPNVLPPDATSTSLLSVCAQLASWTLWDTLPSHSAKVNFHPSPCSLGSPLDSCYPVSPSGSTLRNSYLELHASLVSHRGLGEEDTKKWVGKCLIELLLTRGGVISDHFVPLEMVSYLLLDLCHLKLPSF